MSLVSSLLKISTLKYGSQSRVGCLSVVYPIKCSRLKSAIPEFPVLPNDLKTQVTAVYVPDMPEISFASLSTSHLSSYLGERHALLAQLRQALRLGSRPHTTGSEMIMAVPTFRHRMYIPPRPPQRQPNLCERSSLSAKLLNALNFGSAPHLLLNAGLAECPGLWG